MCHIVRYAYHAFLVRATPCSRLSHQWKAVIHMSRV